MSIRCLIVDDEAPARALIRHHLGNLEGFEIMAECDTAAKAFSFLQQHPVDLAFIDIQMPGISGLELVRSLKVRPAIIFTTAFREYAAEAFEEEVLDYLVKPVTAERFMKAIARFTHRHVQTPDERITNSWPQAYLFCKVGRDQVKIMLKDIRYLEGLSDYIKIHTLHQTYIASETLSHMEERLPAAHFLRIHRSYIVSLEAVTAYGAEEVVLGKTTLPLGRLYKAFFFKRLPR